MGPLSYRRVLEERFLSLRAANSRLSLRGFARRLKVLPSFLSEVLRGKKNISIDRAWQVAEKLYSEKWEQIQFVYLVALEGCTDDRKKNELKNELDLVLDAQARSGLDINLTSVVARWECMALFELIKGRPGLDLGQYGSILEISPSQLERASRDLISSGIIREENEGLFAIVENILFTALGHNLALKVYHSALLEMARTAIFEQNPQTRFTGTELLLLDSEMLPDAHRVLDRCLNELVALAQKSKCKDKIVIVQGHLHELKRK